MPVAYWLGRVSGGGGTQERATINIVGTLVYTSSDCFAATFS